MQQVKHSAVESTNDENDEGSLGIVLVNQSPFPNQQRNVPLLRPLDQTDTISMLSKSKRISLWLLPPDPLMTTLRSVQADIISSHPAERRLPQFEPHVTLIGGVPIAAAVSAAERQELATRPHARDVHEDAADVVLRRLRAAFRAHGGVACDFVPERGAGAVRTPRGDGAGNGTVPWNQSCVSIVERNASFMTAMRVADGALFATTRSTCHDSAQSAPSVERHFKAPLFEPHFSFAYGNDANLIPASLTCPPPFTAYEMVVMWTHPSSLDAVEKWEPIGRVCLI